MGGMGSASESLDKGSEADGRCVFGADAVLRVSKHSALVTGCGRERKAAGAEVRVRAAEQLGSLQLSPGTAFTAGSFMT